MKMIMFWLFLSPICHEHLLKVKRNCYIVDFPLDPINFENIESLEGQVQLNAKSLSVISYGLLPSNKFNFKLFQFSQDPSFQVCPGASWFMLILEQLQFLGYENKF